MRNFSEKGFTLIELLASVVIIGIIFSALFHFLGQTINMSSTVSDQYVMAQLAEREVELQKSEELAAPADPENDNPIQIYTETSNNKDYTVEVSLYPGEVDETGVDLTRLRVEVSDPDSGRSSVAYEWYIGNGGE